ncbi:MAG: DUF3000 family protein [Micrococcales bacterium]
MFTVDLEQPVAPEFALAVKSLNFVEPRKELHVEQIPAPGNLARHAVAFAAHVTADHQQTGDAGIGRLVFLWDDEPQENWVGRFRVVCFAKSPLESHIGQEAVSADLAWDWLTTALRARNADYAAEAGTATRILSAGYGALAHQDSHAELEMRASWSPIGGDLAPHLAAWQDLICVLSGYSPLPEGIARLV